MNWLQSILYGLLTGVTEFLPVSSEAHQLLLRKLFDLTPEPLENLAARLGALLALVTCCRGLLQSLRRERALYQNRRNGRRRATKGIFDIRLVRSAAVPLLLGLLFTFATAGLRLSLTATALFLLLNGVILFAPERMSAGNKDARAMRPMDGFLIGAFGALSVFPGISRVGAMASVATGRGASRQNALAWALLLSIPALCVLMGFDVLQLIPQGAAAVSWQRLPVCGLTLLASYVGGYFSILTVQFLTVRTGFSGFAYYCWGAALFLFVLYLAI